METDQVGKPSPFVVREAEEKDCPQIYQLNMELADFINSRSDVTRTLDEFTNDLFGKDPLCRCVVASTQEEDPPRIIGFINFYRVYASWTGPVLYVEDFYVEEKYRGIRVGDALWKKCLKTGSEMGCKGVRLHVDDWNATARNFYKRRGFTDSTDTGTRALCLSRQGMEEYLKKL